MDKFEGALGANLFRLEGSIRWCIAIVAIYALASLGLAAFILQCPSDALAIRVLPSGTLPVNQFYSGLLLSVFLTPVAIALRKLSQELATYYPFAIASKTSTSLADLDALKEGGWVSCLGLFRYSPLTAIVQLLLVAAGAIIVPVGTLMIFTGSYAAPSHGTSFVGMPLLQRIDDPTGLGTMYGAMDNSFFDDGVHSLNGNDGFGNLTSRLFTGRLIQTGGLLPEPSYVLGPAQNLNLTFQDGVRYDDILTFHWAANCRNARAEVPVTNDSDASLSLLGFHFPGTGLQQIVLPNNDHVLGWSRSNKSGIFGQHVPNLQNFTLYYGIVAPLNGSVGLDAAKQLDGWIETIGDYWALRVACHPSMAWQNGSMTACTAASDDAPAALDTKGLDALVYYMSAIPVKLQLDKLHLGDTTLFGLQPIQYALQYDTTGVAQTSWRVPMPDDFEKLYGQLASTVADAATSGYFGAAPVATTGSPAVPAYKVRVYVLAVVLAMLVGAPALAGGWLLWCVCSRAPLRQATVLTLATALRGPQWDAALHDGCALQDRALRRRHRPVRVRYGVDRTNPSHIGFAGSVDAINPTARYSGTHVYQQNTFL